MGWGGLDKMSYIFIMVHFSSIQNMRWNRHSVKIFSDTEKSSIYNASKDNYNIIHIIKLNLYL